MKDDSDKESDELFNETQVKKEDEITLESLDKEYRSRPPGLWGFGMQAIPGLWDRGIKNGAQELRDREFQRPLGLWSRELKSRSVQ